MVPVNLIYLLVGVSWVEGMLGGLSHQDPACLEYFKGSKNEQALNSGIGFAEVEQPSLPLGRGWHHPEEPSKGEFRLLVLALEQCIIVAIQVDKRLNQSSTAIAISTSSIALQAIQPHLVSSPRLPITVITDMMDPDIKQLLKVANLADDYR